MGEKDTWGGGLHISKIIKKKRKRVKYKICARNLKNVVFSNPNRIRTIEHQDKIVKFNKFSNKCRKIGRYDYAKYLHKHLQQLKIKILHLCIYIKP